MVMNNYQMIGFNKLDNFDIRMSLTVIAAFGVITLVSYFNELARAGLLSKRHQPEPAYHLHSRHVRAAALIQSNKQLHKLNLDIRKIKDGNHPGRGKPHPTKEMADIKFELHLGKDKAYERSNGSKVKIYSHKNTLPNFFTAVVNQSLLEAGRNSSSDAQQFENAYTLLQRKKKKYKNATVVLLYQHEPGGHFFKDCFKHLAYSSNMTVSQGISASYRKEWEAQPQRRKNSYKYMYGGVSFGVCEDISHGCLYSIIVSHPIDRLMTTYFMCKENPTHSFCRFPKLNLKKISIHDFIKVQGNRLFQRLLYYNKHCRLIGNDEICLRDIKTSFVLTNAEYKVHMKNILQNIESWFAVIGLVDHLNQSLTVFDSVLNMNMSRTCSPYWQQSRVPGWYLKTRQRLLKDPKVLNWLHADLAIYDTLTQVFKKQQQLSQRLKQLQQLSLEGIGPDANVGGFDMKHKKSGLQSRTVFKMDQGSRGTKHSKVINNKTVNKFQINKQRTHSTGLSLISKKNVTKETLPKAGSYVNVTNKKNFNQRKLTKSVFPIQKTHQVDKGFPRRKNNNIGISKSIDRFSSNISQKQFANKSSTNRGKDEPVNKKKIKENF